MKLALHTRVLIGFLVGTIGGALAFWWTQHGGDAAWVNAFVETITQPAGQLFLKLRDVLLYLLALLFQSFQIHSLGQLFGVILLELNFFLLFSRQFFVRRLQPQKPERDDHEHGDGYAQQEPRQCRP